MTSSISIVAKDKGCLLVDSAAEAGLVQMDLAELATQLLTMDQTDARNAFQRAPLSRHPVQEQLPL